ncbi:MAG: IS4 family transposase [Chloroflexi bacterium]|nr:IS4 family transposase [Chloroflexota bacterium]
MLVCKQEFTEEIVGKIREMITVNPGISRRDLSLRVCHWLNWKSPNGKFQEMSCRVALLKLERRGIIKLPQPHSWGCNRDHEKDHAPPVREVGPVCCSLEELGGVDLVRIDSPDIKESKTWNALMRTYHYLGAGPLCGAQIRYLITSRSFGWLGGLAFSAAAWRVEARDRWIGWSEEARREGLSRVVCNSRFLILPQVRVPNLASYVLSVATRHITKDWTERYGFAPLLAETFVERERYSGTCYRAANWQLVGMTQGRGRQDRERNRSLPVKDIYVYPLHPNARKTLCGEVFSGRMKCISEKETPARDWPEEELAQADLGDRRLARRLVSILRDFYARPQASIPQACQTRAKTKATYRFLEHPEMTLDKILHSHYEATLGRLRTENIVLAVQDTTTLNYTAHPATENLGPIGYRLEKGIGLILHDTMAFNPDGIPLGLLDVQCWARDGENFGKKRRRHELPIEQKESHKWLVSFRKTAQAQSRYIGKSTFVSIGDREADIYELFELALREPAFGGPQLLVRAIHDRLLGEGQGHLWGRVARQEVSGIQEVKIPRRGNCTARVARLEVRFAQVSLKPPRHKSSLRDLTVWAVLAREISPPEGVAPVEWLLLTTMEVTTFEQAVEKLAWYTVRWGIEVYHRTLKSGCKIEERQLGTADRIEACLAIDMVVAWRIVYLTRLGRDTPEVPCTVYFEEAEWKALTAYVTQNPVPPERPPTLREATRMVASLGGFLGRKGDGEPGTKSLWIGLQRLDDLTAMWKIMNPSYVPHPPNPPVSSNPGYG